MTAKNTDAPTLFDDDLTPVDRSDIDRADLDRADLDRADLDRADLDRAGEPVSGRGTVEPVVVFTDGACAGNPGPGGWGWAVAPDGEPRGSGGEPTTTNQRMELMAVLEALRALGVGQRAGPVVVVSDSTYVVNCFRDGWWVKWQRNGWKNSKKEPVANLDIWKPLVDIVNSGDVTFRWVKGHSGDRMNDLVDRLAVAAVPDR